MKTTLSIFAILILNGAVAASAIGQTPRPTPTPLSAPRPTPTPLSAPRPTPAAVTTNAPVPDSRIALIDTSAFGDEKNGIYRYVDAAKLIQNEFKTRTGEIQNLQNRLTVLSNELEALVKVTPPDQKTIQAKQQQGDALQTEYAAKKDKYDQDLSKRYEQVVSPISTQIGAAMDQFARQRGITMTLDISKLVPAILTALPATDLTQAFINDFNSKNPRVTTSTTPRP